MTKEELRRKIAELTGWTEIWQDAIHDDEDGWYTAMKGQPPTGDYQVIPDWPNDPDAALELMPVGCSLKRVDSDEWPGKWECTQITDYFTMDNITRYGDTPEMAICEWYVAARDAEAVTND